MREIRVGVNNEIYLKSAIAGARSAFAKYLNLRIVPLSTGNVELIFQINPGVEDNAREIVLEFLNYILDYSIQIFVERNVK